MQPYLTISENTRPFYSATSLQKGEATTTIKPLFQNSWGRLWILSRPVRVGYMNIIYINLTTHNGIKRGKNIFFLNKFKFLEQKFQLHKQQKNPLQLREALKAIHSQEEEGNQVLSINMNPDNADPKSHAMVNIEQKHKSTNLK